jgi:acyl carrier protein
MTPGLWFRKPAAPQHRPGVAGFQGTPVFITVTYSGDNNMELRDQILEKMIERASEIFQKSTEELDEDTDFSEDLRAKSVNLVQIIAFLEDGFDVEINFMAFRRRNTFGDAADFVAELCEE